MYISITYICIYVFVLYVYLYVRISAYLHICICLYVNICIYVYLSIFYLVGYVIVSENSDDVISLILPASGYLCEIYSGDGIL